MEPTKLDEKFTTLAEHLLGDGYRTACFTNNPYLSEKFGLVQGFEEVQALWQRKDRGRPPSRLGHGLALAWAEALAGFVTGPSRLKMLRIPISLRGPAAYFIAP